MIDVGLPKFAAYAAAALLFVTTVEQRPAFAIEVAVAKQCNAMMAKAFPPREPGNPAAGSAKGKGSDQRAYFQKCVANNGKMEDAAATDKK